jgi:hypothetical protein
MHLPHFHRSRPTAKLPLQFVATAAKVVGFIAGEHSNRIHNAVLLITALVEGSEELGHVVWER